MSERQLQLSGCVAHVTVASVNLLVRYPSHKMGFGKSEPPAAPVAEAEPADDLDYMEEDLEEEIEQPADADQFDGPRAWEDVEETESQRVSLSISTHAVPSNDSGEAAARLAWQAAVLESENQDPLGLGRIDAHGLRLVSGLANARSSPFPPAQPSMAK